MFGTSVGSSGQETRSGENKKVRFASRGSFLVAQKEFNLIYIL